jgi:NAD(P)-dependent dehydrogenase (short-subunit alcohol dehydrogenase family)
MKRGVRARKFLREAEVRLENRVGIVTGAGRNIGEAIAHRFAAEGARVAVVDIEEGTARQVAAAINATQPEAALAIRCDVSQKAEVQSLIAQVVERWGGIDILVNNVAVTDRVSILDLEEDEWDRVMRITLKSVYLCTKYVAQQMVEQGRGGCIVNIASTSGHRGRKDATAYSAAKGGLLNFTRSLAVQLAPHGIRVNSVTPNRIGSPVGEAEVPANRPVTNLVGRRGIPEDIAAAVAFLASNDATFVDAADILVDGGSLAAGGP